MLLIQYVQIEGGSNFQKAILEASRPKNNSHKN